MGYKCGNCGIDFPSKREIVEHMLDVHNSPYIEGTLSDVSDKIIQARANDTAHTKNAESKNQQTKVKFARGE